MNILVLAHEIIDCSAAFISCSFNHEFRTSNVEAHNLAKHAFALGGLGLGQPSFVPVNIVRT
jgi:hypothetical protein